MKNHLFLIIFFCVCLSAQAQNKVQIYQNEIALEISPKTKKVKIKKNSFAFRFYQKSYSEAEEYAIHLAAFSDKAEWKKLKAGTHKNQTTCFRTGSSRAGYNDKPYPSLLIENNSSHYLYYENENSKRLKLLDEKGAYLWLEFEVDKLEYEGKINLVAESQLSQIYIAVWIDRNLNETIDTEELYQFAIKLD